MSIWRRGNSGLAVQNCGEAFWSQGAHALLKQAFQVSREVVELEEFVACIVEASWGTVTLNGRVLSLVRAHVCMFVGKVASSATDPTVFVF